MTLIDDWFALLNHGHMVTATGNSDTHHLDHNIGGYPRNYVRVLEDRPDRLKPFEVARARAAARATPSSLLCAPSLPDLLESGIRS